MRDDNAREFQALSEIAEMSLPDDVASDWIKTSGRFVIEHDIWFKHDGPWRVRLRLRWPPERVAGLHILGASHTPTIFSIRSTRVRIDSSV